MCTEHKIPNEQSGANSEPGNVLEPAEQCGIALEHPTDRVDRAELVEAGHIVAQSLHSTGLVAVLQERVNYIYYGKMGIGSMWSYSDSQLYSEQEDWQINGYIQGGLAAEFLFCNDDCEIDYYTWNEYTKGTGFEAVDNWHGWISRFSDAAIRQLEEPVSAWAADLAIGWMNNPRPMITLQNALWVYREFWCNNDSQQPPEPNSFNHYWGWNEIPLPRKQIINKDNWTCFIIVLPPSENLDITLSQWLLDKNNTGCVENLIEQLNKYMKYNLVPNLSQVLVVKQIPNDSESPHKVWKRWFCIEEEVEILGSDTHGWKIGQNGVIQQC